MKNFRIVEELDNGEEVITYFQIEEYDDGYYYVYNETEVGPFPTLDDAVEGAQAVQKSKSKASVILHKIYPKLL